MKLRIRRRALSRSLLALLCLAAVPRAATSSDDAAASPAAAERRAAKGPQSEAERRYLEMSPMGAVAAGVAPRRGAREDGPAAPGAPARRLTAVDAQVGGADIVVHGPGDAGLQSETTIAANADGSILVAGYNDARGFDVVPLSLSGISRSTDGGATWNEVGVGPGGLGVLPSVTNGSVYGDPDVRFDPTRDLFVYSSIYVRPDGRQGLSLHTSNSGADAGSIWSTPIEISPAFSASASADKEFIDVNPVTGRILVTWSSFAAASIKILGSYSDDLGANWSSAATLTTTGGSLTGVQASVPRFLPGTEDADSQAYVVWRTTLSGNLRNIACARSTDGGASWSSAADVDNVNFAAEDQILGVDRINTSPSMAIDYTSGRVYVVYMRTNSVGTGDVALRSFIGDCAAAAPVLLSSDPGNDRSQFYPFVTVDQSNGRVHVMWYDQDIDASGDRTELMHTFSDDQGASWSPPAPLFDRPFRAGFGNDTSQPNLGDYLQGVAQDGKFHSLAASTGPRPSFDEGLPGFALIGPDATYDQLADAIEVAPLRLQEIVASEIGCVEGSNSYLDPGESADLTVTLENYVANAVVGAGSIGSITGTLSSDTSGVEVTQDTASFPTLAALATGANSTPFTISLAPSFVAGTPIRLTLSLDSDSGLMELPIELESGTPGSPTDLISEDFEGVTPPAFPASWSSNVGAGASVPWVTSDTFLAGGNKAAYHPEGGTYLWSRLFSPIVTVPTPGGGVIADVTLDLDIRYDLEEEPAQNVLAYDGFFLRITNQTSGETVRSVLAEAIALDFQTGSMRGYPRHLPRSSNQNYFEDMSVWSGDSDGLVHVSMRFDGAGMYGRDIQLRFEYTDDGAATCVDLGRGPCGAAVDNVFLRYVERHAATCTVNLFSDGFETGTAPWSFVVGEN